MRILRHTVVLLLVGLAFVVSPASALGARVTAPRDESKPTVHNALDFLHDLGSLVTSLWSKNGCHIDPWGVCVSGTGESGATAPAGDGAAKSDEGCAIDPWGGCAGGR